MLLRPALLVFSALFVVYAAPDNPPTNDWLIVPGVRVGPITPSTTRADLNRLFGAKNVTDEDVTVSDAGPEPGTIVNKQQPGDSIVIFWGEGMQRQRIESLTFCIPQPPYTENQQACRWHTPENITFGTTLTELERLNGRPFNLLGFQWDYEGTVTSWNGGALEARLDPVCGGLGLRVIPQEHLTPAQGVSADQFSGDKTLSSAAKGMHELNPKVSWISVSFEKCP